MSENSILIRHNYISVEGNTVSLSRDVADLATVAMNLSYYGFALDVPAFEALKTLSSTELANWWLNLEPTLREVTGDDRNIGDFVVYKNFPAECINKSEAQYWFAQILMYWGMPNELFTETVQPREKLSEQPKLKVLRKSGPNTLSTILNGLTIGSTSNGATGGGLSFKGAGGASIAQIQGYTEKR